MSAGSELWLQSTLGLRGQVAGQLSGQAKDCGGSSHFSSSSRSPWQVGEVGGSKPARLQHTVHPSSPNASGADSGRPRALSPCSTAQRKEERPPAKEPGTSQAVKPSALATQIKMEPDFGSELT